MKAEVFAYTQINPNHWNELVRNMSHAEIVPYMARVSNPDNQANHMTGPNLIKYCAKNNHWSIFEMVDVVMKIEVTRDIGRQVIRHRSFSWQEFSQRYADPVNALGFELKEARTQDPKNRQNSIMTDDPCLAVWWEEVQEDAIKFATDTYNTAIQNGIAKEQARAILPEGLTMSSMFMKGSLRSWIHYCTVRRANGTQKEHAELANECWLKLKEIYPFLTIFDGDDK